MSIAVKINSQNQQVVKALTPLGSLTTSIESLPDVAVIEKNNNSTIVYNTTTLKYEVKTLPVIYGGNF
jgi:hypothetical protein